MTGTRRWFIYAFVGLLFGIADWYFLELLAHFPWGKLGDFPPMVLVIIALNFGIWLLPVLPVTFNESRVSGSARQSALAGALCWSSSIISYYSYYTLFLAFWGLPNMEHLLIIREKEAGFWQVWDAAFHKVILNQVIEWLPIAIIGGLLVGLFVWWFSNQRKFIKKTVSKKTEAR